jgi:uncharacterized protein YllA (UPF0747 family)
MRERLDEGKYKINNTKIEYSEDEILTLLDTNPEMFSPNVIMRPLYQEVIYQICVTLWRRRNCLLVELKSFFDAVKVTFPMLLVRNLSFSYRKAN